jgi:tetratricopeptide (TPR) repeat protein
VTPRRELSLAVLLVFALLVTGDARDARAQDAAGVASRIEAVQRALDDWQLDRAVKLSEELYQQLPNVPPVQAVVGAVKFHQGDYDGAVRMLERAAEGGTAPALLDIARSTREETKGFVSQSSEHFVVRTAPGKDEILAPIALRALEDAYRHVSEAFDYRPDHKIPVDVLHDPKGLASVSTLTVDEIRTSGTIALCKYNRLMITSPKALARGYGWLDTLAHELIHLVISEKSHNNVPIWLHEGLAKYSESLWRDGTAGLALDPASENLLAKATKSGELITFEQMHPSMAKLPSQEDTALAFAEVFTVIEMLHKESGYAKTNKLLLKLRDGLTMDAALVASVGTDLKGLQRKWNRYLRARKFKRTPGAEPRELRFVGDARRRAGGADADEAEAALAEAKGRKARRYVRLGNLLRERGRLRAATVEYEKARARSPLPSPILGNRLASLYLELKEKEKARGAVQEALKIFPDDPQAHVLMGRIALLEQEWATAKKHYLRTTWENPFHPEVWVGLLRVAERTDDAALIELAKKNLKLLAGHAKADGGAASYAPGEGEPFGTLSISSSPWGRVWIDGEDTGATTPLIDLPLTPGAHRVRVEDPIDGRLASVEVLVRDGHAERMEMSLKAVSEAEREAIYKLESAAAPAAAGEAVKAPASGGAVAE